MIDDTGTWHPSEQQVENANVTAIMRKLGLVDYDALYAFSVREPETYWRAVLDSCDVQWSRPYDQFVDFSRGREFPHWFVGGKLNWTDSIFKWAKNPSTRDDIALIAEREDGKVVRLTYAELHERVRRFAGGLEKLGIRRGDAVGFLMEPGLEAIVTMIGLSYIGAVVLPLFSGFGAEPIASRLTLCRARALIATSGFKRRQKFVDRAQVVKEAAAQANLEFLIIMRDEYGLGDASGTIDWATIADGPLAGPDAEPMSTQDTYMVFFTSGTTGLPKGIVHTHGGFPLKISHDSHIHFDMKKDDVYFWPADMGWIAGALSIAATMMQGATMVCFDGAPDYPDWSRMSKMIEQHRVTIFGGAPTMIRGFAAHEAEATVGDLSSLRLMITGGEAIDPEHFIWHGRAFGGGTAPLINYSGGTEASGGLVSSVIVKPIPASGFNTGCPGIVVDVVDSAGKILVGEVGELIIREPFIGMTKSFWEDDARYLETYWQLIPGLWVHGDLAMRDRNGNFFLRGRSDDTIKLAGKRIGPAEIEDILMEVPEMNEVAAIGVDDPAKGQILVVFAVCQEVADRTELARRIADHADKRLGRAFRPNRVHLITQLPKTRTSKVMRRLIRGAYCGLPLGDTSSLDNPAALDEIARASQV